MEFLYRIFDFSPPSQVPAIMVILRMTSDSVTISQIENDFETHRSSWLRLRRALWPDLPGEEHAVDMIEIVGEPRRYAAFLAFPPNGQCVAFAEAAIRHDYVNGCESTPVAFLEGIFVEPAHRRKGIARALCAAAEDWAVLQGCSELASDADIANTTSHMMHRALGFTETERVVFFRKSLLASP
jgi:aminoglycoside 6'-N-acetyltransferase I